jgi:alkanesulfonate monooxygenase SsuD/methylene tetrahydromethanopterin reductase-like flavin-dependent oxidoreductase (luciferase family)
MVDAYRSAEGRGPLVLQVHLSFARDEDTALRIAHQQWRTNVFSPPLCWDVDSVETFDEAAKYVQPEDMRGPVLVSADPEQHVEWIRGMVDTGFDEVYLHHVGQELDEFLDVFGAEVLPHLGVTARKPA